MNGRMLILMYSLKYSNLMLVIFIDYIHLPRTAIPAQGTLAHQCTTITDKVRHLVTGGIPDILQGGNVQLLSRQDLVGRRLLEPCRTMTVALILAPLDVMLATGTHCLHQKAYVRFCLDQSYMF